MFVHIVVLAALVALTTAKPGTWPIGINLGIHKITSAYISVDGEPVPVASIDGSQHLQQFMATAALKDQSHEVLYELDAAQDVFSDALRAISVATAAKLSPRSAINISSITMPDYLQHHQNVTLAVINAAKAELSGSFTQYYQLQTLIASARMTYKLNTCEGLRLALHNCNIEDGHYVLFLDLNPHHLQIALADIDSETIGVHDRVLSLVLGAQYHARDTAQWTTSVHRALTDFASRNLFNETGSTKPRVEHLEAIVMSGEADTESIDALKTILGTVLPDHRGIVRDTVAYQYVGAVGAAYWSKLQIDEPDSFRTITPFMHAHDEL